MLPPYARLLTLAYLWLIVWLTAFRGLGWALVRGNLKDVPGPDIVRAFAIGWRFDNVIACGTLVIPFLLLTLNHFAFRSPRFQRWALAPLWPLWTLVLVLQTIDVFYFEHFGLRTTVILLNWLDDLSFAVSMAVGDPRWWWGFAAFPAVWLGLLYPVWRMLRTCPPATLRRTLYWAPACLVVTGLFFLGIRGRVAIKSPLREGLAYFSPNPTLNQLALNPTFTFFSSWIRSRKYRERPLRFMPHEEALALLRREPGRVGTEGHALAGGIAGGTLRDWNVVVVMMEGMSAHYSNYRKNPSWTPVLDRLNAEGLEFSQAYSAGTHTYNGVWSTLFSFPSPYAGHPLKRDVIPQLDAWPDQWRRQGRHTYFFTTHDEEFDNMAGFLRQNGFTTIVAQSDYPTERVFSILGVPDHDMYERAVEEFGKRPGPFFAALLTGSNHKPYVIPPEHRARFNSGNEKEDIVRYSDWAVGHFLAKAAEKPWFRNTLFVFLADHGQSVGDSALEQMLAYHHMPLIFWGPALLGAHRKIDRPVGQIDILPTIAGLIGGGGRNNSLGRDVLAHPRDWVYMVRDDAACVRWSALMECETPEGVRTRFELPAVWPAPPPDSAGAWREVHAHLQLADWVLRTLSQRP